MFKTVEKSKTMVLKAIHNLTSSSFIKTSRRVGRKTISKQINSAISIILITIMLSTNILIYSISYMKIYRINDNSLKIICNEVSENFKGLIKIQTNDVERLLQNEFVTNILNKRKNINRFDFLYTYSKDIKDVSNLLNSLLINKEFDEHIFITDMDGVIVADSNSEFLNNNYGEHEFIKKALQGEKAISSVYTSVVSSKNVVSFVEPVKDNKGNIIGCIGKNVYIDYFSARFDKFTIMNTGHLFILDSGGKITYHPNKYNINKQLNVPVLQSISKDKSKYKNTVYGSVNYSKDSDNFIAHYISVPEIKSILVLNINEKEIKKECIGIGLIFIIATILILIIIIPTLCIIIKKILKPMGALIKNTKEISKGNLMIKNNIVEDNEIGELTISFNEMTDSIKLLLNDIKDIINETANVDNMVKESQQVIAAGMEAMSRDSSTIAGDSEKVDRAIQQCFIKFDDISRKIISVKGISKAMMGKVDRIKTVNQQGMEVVDNLKITNSKVIDDLKDVNKSIIILNMNLQDIKTIANSVNNISRQTNILALNASIEAAKAGEYGLGFSVVAVEIKKLSYVIKDQMNRIDEIINKININMEITQNRMLKVNDVAKNQIDVVNNTIDNYHYVMSSSEEIVNYIKNIDDSIEILNEENVIVNNALKEVESVTSDFNSITKAVNEIVEEEYMQTKNMDELMEILEITIRKLQSNINRFNM